MIFPLIYMTWSLTIDNARLCNDTNGQAGNETWIETGDSVVFASPDFPSSYGTNGTTDWVFCAVDPNARIEIDCAEFEVGLSFPLCFDDFLFISADSSLGLYCGTTGPQSVFTTGRGTAVCLISLGWQKYGGFNCVATAVVMPDAETTTAANEEIANGNQTL